MRRIGVFCLSMVAAIAASTTIIAPVTASVRPSPIGAFTIADRPAPQLYHAYAPRPEDTYSSTGGSVSITRVGTGHYLVAFQGLQPPSGNSGVAQVSAYGDTALHCNDVALSAAANEVDIEVGCYGVGGVQVNSRFAVSYAGRSSYEGTYAYGYADQPGSTSYTLRPNASFNTARGQIDVDRHGGAHRVAVIGINDLYGVVSVTAWGPQASCQAGQVAQSMGSGEIDFDVTCYDYNGLIIDAPFMFSYAVGTDQIGTNQPDFADAEVVTGLGLSRNITGVDHNDLVGPGADSATNPVSGSNTLRLVDQAEVGGVLMVTASYTDETGGECQAKALRPSFDTLLERATVVCRHANGDTTSLGWYYASWMTP